MIPKDKAKILRKFVGSNYSLQLDDFFKERNVRNRNGEFYSKEMIARVFNGGVQNDKIEEVIWEFIDELTKKRREIQERQEELIKTAKDLTRDE